MEVRSIKAPKSLYGQLQSYFEAAMKKYEENRRNMGHQSAGRSTVCAKTLEANFACCEDIVNEGVVSHSIFQLWPA